MQFTQSFLDQPHQRCVACPRLGVYCDGRNFLAHGLTKFAEWCRLRKNYLLTLEPNKWTNKYIADEAGVSLKTVERLMSGKITDMSVYTASQILRVLVNGTWGQNPCPLDFVTAEEQEAMDNARLIAAECKKLGDDLEEQKALHRRTVDFLKEEIAEKNKQLEAKDTLLAERREFIKRKDRFIVLLAVLLGLCVAIIVAALVVDAFNDNLGFFWFPAEAAAQEYMIGGPR